MNYAKAFRIVRAAFGLRQSVLSDRLNISANQLSLIEAGKRQPSLRVINSLSAVVGIPSALVTLLASSPEDVESHPDQDVSDLAKVLLRLLVSASEEKQGVLPFGD